MTGGGHIFVFPVDLRCGRRIVFEYESFASAITRKTAIDVEHPIMVRSISVTQLVNGINICSEDRPIKSPKLEISRMVHGFTNHHCLYHIDAMVVRLTPKSTRFGDDFVGTRAHWMLARLSPLDFGCCHEPVYSPSYVGATACPLIPSNDRNALNG